jgi:prevent-host-death family protein
MTMSIRPASKPISYLAAGEFKAKCLQIMDDVASSGRTVVITKRGKPVAQLSPAIVRPSTLFGFMKGRGQIIGDILAPIDETWNANAD